MRMEHEFYPNLGIIRIEFHLSLKKKKIHKYKIIDKFNIFTWILEEEEDEDIEVYSRIVEEIPKFKNYIPFSLQLKSK